MNLLNMTPLMNFKIFIIILLSIFHQSIQGQVIPGVKYLEPTVFSSSPQASSLGAYGKETVNMFSGQPNINLPLYSISTSDFNMPISLNYNLESVKPTEHPGIMGLGWSLIFGGVVNRVVKGGVDEIMTPHITPESIYSYYDNYGTLNRADWFSYGFMNNLANCMATDSPSGLCSYPASDEFHFSVNGINGSFYKNHEGKWIVSSSENLDFKITDEIAHDYQIRDKGFHPVDDKTFTIKRIIHGFTLTDSKGIRYIFGKQPNSIEFSAQANPIRDSYNTHFVAKAWFLTKIILPNAKEIDFEYSYDYHPVFKLYMGFGQMAVKIGGHMERSGVNAKNFTRDFYMYPSKIKTDEVEVNFYKSLSNSLDYNLNNAGWGQYEIEYSHHYGTAYQNNKHWYKLDSMVVKSNVTGKRVYKLQPQFIDNPDSRLFLTGIKEYGKNNSNERIHSFEYNQTPLPPLVTQKIDHWGFYNNLDFFEHETPENGDHYSYNQLKWKYSTYREPSSDQNIREAGVLKIIKFPTKGFTEFFYEPNTYSKYLKTDMSSQSFIVESTANHSAGGLRIKKIIHNPEINNDQIITKEYFYVQDYMNGNMTSSGVLGMRPTYFEEYSEQNDLQFFKLISHPILNPIYPGASQITYSKVYEKNSLTGTTEFIFSNQDNGSLDQGANHYIHSQLVTNELSEYSYLNKLRYNSMSHERGKLLFMNKYDNNNVLVEKTQLIYSNDPNRFDSKIRSIDFSSKVYGRCYPSMVVPGFTECGLVREIIDMSAYTTYAYHSPIIEKITTLYNSAANNPIITSENYSYNSGLFYQLKEVKTTNSLGEEIRSEYKYPQDLEWDRPYLSILVAQNRVADPVQTKTYNSTQSTPLSTQEIIYDDFNLSPYVYQVLPKYIFTKKNSNDVNISPTGDDLEITYDKYDIQGNLTQYTLVDGTPVRIVWGYGTETDGQGLLIGGPYPIAKIENPPVNDSNFESYIHNLKNSSLSGNPGDLELIFLQMIRIFPNSKITGYTYEPLIGVKSITQNNGQKETYEYDGFGRLIQVLDHNGKVLKKINYNYKD